MAAESAPPEQGTALTVWAEQDHDFYYPRADATIPQADALSAVKLIGRDWDKTSAKTHMDVMKTVIKKQFRNKKEPGKFPLRTKFADIPVNGLEQTILTNHLEFTIHDTLLYEYEILDLEAGGQSRKKIQALFRKAIAQWPFLKDDQDSFATDGQKTIVSWKKLHGSMDESKLVYQGAGKDHEGSIWQEDIPGAKSTSLPVRFNYVGPVNVADLLKQTQCDLSKITADLSSVERCINILISKSFNNSVVKLSGKKFFVRSARDDLGGSQSLEIIRGYYYAVRPSVGNLLLNFNVATSAFFRPILVSEFLNDGSTFGKQGERLSLLMRLRVYVEHEHADKRLNRLGARIKTIQAVGDDEGRNIEDLFFHKKQIGAEGKPFKLPNDEWAREAKPTYVTQHHLDVFGIKVVRGRPAVNVGAKDDPVWYAQEALRIIPYQVYTRPVPDQLTGSMVEKAAYHPAQSQWLIENEGLRHLGFDHVVNQGIQMRNGVPLTVYPTMLKVPSARMPFPSVRYQPNSYKKSKADLQAKAGSGWNIGDDEAFFSPRASSLKYYIIHRLVGAKANQTIANFEAELRNQMHRRLKMNISQVTCVNRGGAAATLADNNGNMEHLMMEAQTSRAGLVVLMLPSPDRATYASFKNLADRQLGLRSLCVAKPSQLADVGSRSIAKYMTNIAQKINIKFEGFNAQVEGISEALGSNTLVLGADVIHPGYGAFEDSPSIACIVGSVDNQAGRFLGSARLQSKDKKDREIIDHVKEMVLERIRDWKTFTNSTKVPFNIIYYRDGVSEGQYKKVVAIELKAIEQAWEEYRSKSRQVALAGEKLRITALVGVKRHHTRFYPMRKEDKDSRFGNDNCLPGTWVDRGVTSPYYRDFYLQSHSGIKGTARPTHYFTLRNDQIPSCKLTENLRELTHKLCYTYCRATTGVSYATPTYYADRLCDRARLYLPKTWSGSDPVFMQRLEKTKNDELEKLQHARNVVYRAGRAVQAGDVKDAAELAQEIQDGESVRRVSRELVLEYAKKEFYAHKDQAVGNPWHDGLAQTMFWM